MEPAKFKRGDKAILDTGVADDTVSYYEQDENGKRFLACRISNGEVLEIDAVRQSRYGSHWVCQFIHPEYGRRVIAERFLKPYTGQHACNCPPENFTWNGKGCVCGGI